MLPKKKFGLALDLVPYPESYFSMDFVLASKNVLPFPRFHLLLRHYFLSSIEVPLLHQSFLPYSSEEYSGE